ncbi:MAG: hypothetical protein QOC78_57 [Solirubrobacteraceae bacterium]|nr:hypothetical protein [Solirubrobacteraceae bacterium]
MADDGDDGWRYERFVTMIEQRTGLTWERAERAARATLQTLGERLSWEQARDLAEELPHELRTWLLSAGGDVDPFDAHEFVRRVAEREAVDVETAARHGRAVLIAVARLAGGDQIAAVASALAPDYEPLIGEAVRRRRDPAAPEPMPLDDFLASVETRAGLDRPGAERAVDAVLETVAERIASGQVDDLAEVLPDGLRPALERGKASSGGLPQSMTLQEFLARIAQRAGTTPEEALRHARAVFAALREALPPKELSDVLAQLPREYDEALL